MEFNENKLRVILNDKGCEIEFNSDTPGIKCEDRLRTWEEIYTILCTSISEGIELDIHKMNECNIEQDSFDTEHYLVNGVKINRNEFIERFRKE